VIGETIRLYGRLHCVTFEAEVDYGKDEDGRALKFTVQRAAPFREEEDGSGSDAAGPER
jgi:hypothetical protein